MKLKKVLLVLLSLFILSSYSNAQKVYITKSGKKYHTENCRYLSQSKIELSLKEAIAKGYAPCKVCKPTSEVTEQKSSTPSSETKKVEKTKSETYSGRCQATTKKGTQCKRKAAPGSQYCWQHQR